MNYILTFLEGIITFISPCLLPMLPVYVSYFVGLDTDEIANKDTSGNIAKRNKALTNSLGFVLGFTIVFVILGAFAGTAGRFLIAHQTAFNIVTGILMILFGISFMGFLRLPSLNLSQNFNVTKIRMNFFSSILFGLIFSIGWTPCVGAFLGSALVLAAQTGETGQGILMLLCYSLGLGIPFVISAVLIDSLKSTFDAIKKHYTIIKIVSGGLLIIFGILTITGFMGYFLSLLTF